jgi:Tfp pilus assembly protein PilW
MGVRGRGGSAGYTLIELAVGGFLALFVVLALGHVILQNQRSWEWGRDKAVLQQNATEGIEWMARAVRAARRLEVISRRFGGRGPPAAGRCRSH